MTRNTI